MKIYKSSLQELLNEALAPFYICNFCEFSGSDIRWRTAKVTVAAFNEEDRVCELVLSTQPVPHFDVEGAKKQQQQADEWEKEIRARLKALDDGLSGDSFEIRDGRISDQQVLGGIDG